MISAKGEPLELHLRSWHQDAERAVRDAYDALVEIITNADDRYVVLERKHARIEIEIERRRHGSPNIIRVRDFADGMTLDDMRAKIKKVGPRMSGMAEGKPVRGTNARGAKDVAILGGVRFESIARDGRFHYCEVSSHGYFTPGEGEGQPAKDHRARLGIPNGTGTLVTILVDPDKVTMPQQDKLKSNLCLLVALRDILSSPEREVVLGDAKSGSPVLLRPPICDGTERVKETISIPGYPDARAKLVIKRAHERFGDEKSQFRLGGILIKSRHAVHEATLFSSEMERDPHAKWFFGRLQCDYIDTLWNEYDDRFDQGLKPLPQNPRPIIDPLRKEGLDRDHPFAKALFRECLGRLRPLVEQERKQAEATSSAVESTRTKQRLRSLEKAMAKFMKDEQVDEEDDDEAGMGEPVLGSAFERDGYRLSPPYAKCVKGNTRQYWLSVNQAIFPQLSAGDMVEITHASSDISSSKRVDSLQPFPRLEGVLRSTWMVRGEYPTKATSIRARVGPVDAEAYIEVVEKESDLYSHITSFGFGKNRYTVVVGRKRRLSIFAPCPTTVSRETAVRLSCSNDSFKISGKPILIPKPEWGVAVCKLTMQCDRAEVEGRLEAAFDGNSCKADLISREEAGSALEIRPDWGKEFPPQRAYWKGSTLIIYMRHPSVYRYLGPAPEYPGQEELPYRSLVAEIVAGEVCYKILSRRTQARPKDYESNDWDAFYLDYSQLMAKSLPIAHEIYASI